jgi:hypothetical protein
MKETKQTDGPETAEEIRPIKQLPRAVLRRGVLYYGEVPVDQLRAFPVCLAARIIGLSYNTLKEHIDRGLLEVGPNGLISSEALDRFLRGETGRSAKPVR